MKKTILFLALLGAIACSKEAANPVISTGTEISTGIDTTVIIVVEKKRKINHEYPKP